jgi:hypothetical protein
MKQKTLHESKITLCKKVQVLVEVLYNTVLYSEYIAECSTRCDNCAVLVLVLVRCLLYSYILCRSLLQSMSTGIHK